MHIELSLNYLKSTVNSAKFKSIVIYTFAFSLIAHSFVFLNFAPQGDGVKAAFAIQLQDGWLVSLGRFFFPMDTAIRGTMSTPWISGLISTLYIALSVYFVCEILGFEEKGQWLITAGAMSINISLADLYSNYQYSAAPYLFALMLSCRAALILKRNSGWVAVLPSAILLMLSMGFYQAEVAVFLVLMLMMIIKDCLHGRRISIVLKRILRYFVVLAASGVLYYICYKAVLHYYHLSSPSAYNSLSGLRKLEFWQVVADTKANILNYLSYYMGSACFLGIDVRTADLVLFIVVLFFMLTGLVKNHRKINILHILLLVICLCLVPFFSTIMAVLMRQQYIRFYVNYAICLFYPVLLLLKDETCSRLASGARKVLQGIFAACMFIVLFRTTVFTNELYTNQKIIYDRTLSLTTQIMNDLNNQDEYIPGESPVIFIGRLYRNEHLVTLNDTFDGFRSTYKATSNASVTYTDSLVQFIRMVGFSVTTVTDRQILETYEHDSKVLALPSFPEKGYIQKMDEYYVIKLSEWDPDE